MKMQQKKDILYSECTSKRRIRDVDDVGISSSLDIGVKICNQLTDEDSNRNGKQSDLPSESTEDSFQVNDCSKKTCRVDSAPLGLLYISTWSYYI